MNSPLIIKSKIRDVQFGNNVTVIDPVNMYECKIGNNCFVGPFVEIQRGVIIGNQSKVQSHVFICELVFIGNGCFISHGVKFINDLFSIGGPARGNRFLWKETHVGDNVSIGTNATILPITICNNVVIGAGSVVTKDITKPGIYAGNPAVLIRSM